MRPVNTVSPSDAVNALRSPRGSRLSVTPLERRLFLTIVAGLTPLAMLAFFTLFQGAQHQKQEQIQSAQGTTRAIIAAVDAELSASLASLDALAASPRLAANDLAGFYEEARQLQARRPGWMNIILSDAQANPIVNTRKPFAEPPPTRLYPDAISTVVQSGQSVIDDVIHLPVLGTYAFAARVPIKRGKRVAYVLTAVLAADSLQQVLRDQHVPEDGVVGIFDRYYNVVARSLNHDKAIGRPAPPGLRQLLSSGVQSGWGMTTTLEGVRAYAVYYRSPVTGWAAAIGLPVAAVDAPIRRSYFVLVALVLGGVVIGMICAVFVGRAITLPMERLKAAAEALGRGMTPEFPDSQLPEVRQVAAALIKAHEERESLLRTEREARSREHEARMLAERANRMKDEFLAMLGHELRNPLAAISTASLVLVTATGAKPNPKAVESATGIIRRQSAHLSRLTDDLLDAGRVVLGRIQLQRQPVDLAAAVERNLETLRSGNQFANHVLTVSTMAAWVDADPTRLDQIITNVLTNAVRYTPPGGSIDVRVENEAGHAVLKVRDTGVGIEPELMPRIFDLFVQGERAPDRALGGLGIGLTLVQRLTQLHGGEVVARSEGSGRGTEIIIRVPLRGIAPDDESPGDRAICVTPKRIVIVEDNDDVRVSLKMHLLGAGHEVMEAIDGPSGIDLVLDEIPDIALIDIGLPGVDGITAVRTLRARAELQNTQMVAMSGYGSPEDIEAGMQAGFDAYLVKPVDPVRLDALLELTRSELRPRA